MRNLIYEVAVFDGRMKDWRVLNLTTGTIYSPRYVTEAEANEAINDGEVRAGATVKRIDRKEIVQKLNTEHA